MRGRLVVLSLAGTALACATGEYAPVSRPITLGLTRPMGEEAAQAGASELTAYVSKRLGSGSGARVFDDPAQLADALAKGTIDAAWLTPGAYVKAREANPGVIPLVKLMRGGATSYRSVFFSRRDAGGSMAIFRGRRLVLIAKGSMSGRLYPLVYLNNAHIDAHAFFGQLLEAKDHREACQMVLDGKADLGATLSDDNGSVLAQPDGCREAGFDVNQFAVVATSGPVPNDVIAVRAGLEEDVRARLTQLLTGMPLDDGGKAALKSIFRADGFGPASDKDFDIVRDMEKNAPHD